MITPRTTRLVRAANLHAFRAAAATLACDGDARDARDRLVVIPTRAAAAHLLRTIEDQTLRRDDEAPATDEARLLPDLITPGELIPRLAERLLPGRPALARAEREALLGVACRAAQAAGTVPPFRLRPGLLVEVLHFYDTLRRNQKDVDAFERLALLMLEAGASYDRGAERLVRQTRFLVAAFKTFERMCAEHGDDEHALRSRLVTEISARPIRHVVLTVTDRGFDPQGLHAADWDLLARVGGLERLDVLVTDTTLAGALHERLHAVLPGIEEVRFDATSPDDDQAAAPVLVIPSSGALVHVARDREEEVAAFARAVKHAARSGRLPALDRAALVVHQPLPYVYVARDVLQSAAVPCQMFDALPLAAEPYAAAVDLICSAVAGGFARLPAIALLKSAHFDWGGIDLAATAALDRALAEAGYLGEIPAIERLLDVWTAAAESPRALTARALPPGRVLLEIARELAPLQSPAPLSDHLQTLIAFLVAHERLPHQEDPLRARHLRARGAILGMLKELRDAYASFDRSDTGIDETAALVRRWIEGQTFAPRAGSAGVHLVDAASARFGSFTDVHLAGLVDGEWPEHPRRNVFYSPALLKDLGWPSELERRDAARAAFADLLRLPAERLTVSTFSLEADAIVTPSVLVDEVDAAGLDAVEDAPPAHRIFEHEALGLDPIDATALPEPVRVWANERLQAPAHAAAQFHGVTGPHRARAYSLSALERYQDCPFKFFATDVLRLEEAPEDESALSPRARGRFIHEVFQRFYEAWDRRGQGTITADRLDDARSVFAEVAEPLLARLPESDAALERARLFGSAISVGSVDVVLGLEASRPVAVKDRWLEYRLEGEFSLGAPDGTRVALKGVADRIDLLAGNRLRVLDYKSGYPPNVKRALQVPVYALCAQERLSERDNVAWQIEEASYVAFTGKRALVPVVRKGAPDATAVLSSARGRLHDVLGGIGTGAFPPRPHDPMMCRYCAHASVCRKDYVGDE